MQNSYFFIFVVDQTSKNKIVENPLVFKAFSPRNVRFLTDKNAIDKKPFYSIDFWKHDENQLIFNDFVLTSTILLQCTIVRLNPKNVKFHWFFNGFLIFTFRTKIDLLGPFRTSWAARWSRSWRRIIDTCWFPKIIQIPNDFCPKRRRYRLLLPSCCVKVVNARRNAVAIIPWAKLIILHFRLIKNRWNFDKLIKNHQNRPPDPLFGRLRASKS